MASQEFRDRIRLAAGTPSLSAAVRAAGQDVERAIAEALIVPDIDDAAARSAGRPPVLHDTDARCPLLSTSVLPVMWAVTRWRGYLAGIGLTLVTLVIANLAAGFGLSSYVPWFIPFVWAAHPTEASTPLLATPVMTAAIAPGSPTDPGADSSWALTDLDTLGTQPSRRGGGRLLGGGEDGRTLLGRVALADHGAGLHVKADHRGLDVAFHRGTQLHPLEHLVAEDRGRNRSSGLNIRILPVLPPFSDR